MNIPPSNNPGLRGVSHDVLQPRYPPVPIIYLPPKRKVLLINLGLPIKIFSYLLYRNTNIIGVTMEVGYVTSKGQLVIPSKLRKKFGIKAGTRVNLTL